MRHTTWNSKIALELALVLESGLGSVTELLQNNRITEKDLTTFSNDKNFVRAVDEYREDIRDKGLAFKLKARVQAEELLRTSFLLTQDPDVPASVKADLIKATVKWAGYETPAQTQAGPTNGVSITINFRGDGADQKPQLVNITPVQDRQAVVYDEEG